MLYEPRAGTSKLCIFGSTQSGHPLADLKEAKRIAAALAAGEAYELGIGLECLGETERRANVASLLRVLGSQVRFLPGALDLLAHRGLAYPEQAADRRPGG
jgi:hypothetical protein